MHNILIDHIIGIYIKLNTVLSTQTVFYSNTGYQCNFLHRMSFEEYKTFAHLEYFLLTYFGIDNQPKQKS